jgi:hypothetical protein
METASSVGAAGGDPKDDGVGSSEQEVAQTDGVLGEWQDHREQRHAAHASGYVHKSLTPCRDPQTNEVQADDSADGQVYLLLCSESRQQERRHVHAEELGGDGDDVGRRSEKRSRGGCGRLVSPEPHKEDEGDYQGESATGADIGTRQSQSSEQRPECTEEPADGPGNTSSEARPKDLRRRSQSLRAVGSVPRSRLIVSKNADSLRE